MVAYWKKRFNSGGLEGLRTVERPGRPVMCSLYHLDTYKREYIELKRYKGGLQRGFLKLLLTPGYMVI